MTQPSAGPVVTTTRIDRVAVVTLCRPGKHNALNRQMAEGFGEALDSVDDARALVLTGADGSFCSGFDLNETSLMDDSWVVLTERLAALPIPTVAAVSGPCLGGGLALAAVCDFRIAAGTATFGLPEIHHGLFAAQGCTWRLPRLLGMVVTKRLMLRGVPITADTAKAWGLVDETAEDPLSAAVDLAKSMSAAPAEAISVTKELLASSWSTSLDEAIEREGAAMKNLLGRPEVSEKLAHFLGK